MSNTTTNDSQLLRKQTSNIHYTYEMVSEEYQIRIGSIESNNPTYDDAQYFKKNGVKFSAEGYPDFSPYALGEVGKLQQLDGLLQLRCHHQRLALSDL